MKRYDICIVYGHKKIEIYLKISVVLIFTFFTLTLISQLIVLRVIFFLYVILTFKQM